MGKGLVVVIVLACSCVVAGLWFIRHSAGLRIDARGMIVVENRVYNHKVLVDEVEFRRVMFELERLGYTSGVATKKYRLVMVPGKQLFSREWEPGLPYVSFSFNLDGDLVSVFVHVDADRLKAKGWLPDQVADLVEHQFLLAVVLAGRPDLREDPIRKGVLSGSSGVFGELGEVSAEYKFFAYDDI